MWKDEQMRDMNLRDSEKLESLEEELAEMMKNWRGTGLESQRREAIRMEQANLRTAIAERVRMAYDVDVKEEKNSDGRPVSADPEGRTSQDIPTFDLEAHDGDAGQGYVWAVCPVCGESFEHITLPHVHQVAVEPMQQVYYSPMGSNKFTDHDVDFLRAMKITLDEPTPSGKM